MSSNIEKFTKLRESASPVDTAALDSFFDQLPPIPLSHLVGSWNGGFFDTGHPNGDFMKDISWIGKDFFSVDHVDPVIIERDGTRQSWGKWGLASLKEIVFRGQMTSAMIYDDQPVIDYFRLVDDKTVAGIMEGKKLNGPFYFYLTRPSTWSITGGIQGMLLDRVEKEGFLATG
ncbi:GXWXG domain [Fusarium oxysporum f. sp. vasinfectum]|uniref:DUF4334 domain-containing protein n=2 Tax=Fusarium oxysporum TaxID=5507 RepID=X0L333_FUSOX|nr:hypothetical protein FOTG_11691 [Fusarium oxysporum f. sp. vasinfectum 25433]KAK2681894.1 GXWXG domain [Fusarium oxysporum f. sp. vasinfectum]KAK2933675.1 GXWXG domain [Fusarium oxysporum f. sp. vasinfectum]